jgi:hypothetical protein
MRVDHRTKEVLDTWDYQVLKNWAYSKRTFVLVRGNCGGVVVWVFWLGDCGGEVV